MHNMQVLTVGSQVLNIFKYFNTNSSTSLFLLQIVIFTF